MELIQDTPQTSHFDRIRQFHNLDIVVMRTKSHKETKTGRRLVNCREPLAVTLEVYNGAPNKDSQITCEYH